MVYAEGTAERKWLICSTRWTADELPPSRLRLGEAMKLQWHAEGQQMGPASLKRAECADSWLDARLG